MQLKVLIEATGKSWTLKPGREYLMGTSPDCDIMVESIDDSIAFIKFKFDGIGSLWHIENLKKDSTTLLNNQRLTRSIIQAQSQLKVVGQSIVLMPEAIVAPTQVSRQVPQYQRAATQDGSSLNPIVDKAAEYAKIGIAGAEKLFKNVQAAANDMNERSIDRDRYVRNNSKSGSGVIEIGYAGLSSPTDGAGVNLPGFSMSTTMKVDRSKVAEICEQLYEHVNHEINDGTLGNAQSRIVTYVLDRAREEERESRRYILATHNTKNDVRTTIFIRFLGSGDNLFVGIDVYILGQLDSQLYGSRQWSTFLLILISPFTLFLTLIPASSMWDKLRKRVQYEGDIKLARRQEFPGKAQFDAFDEDDVLIFIKTTLHAASDSIAKIFTASKLPIDSLDAFMKQVDSGSATVVNNYGSMDMRGAAFGSGNKAGYSNSVSK